MFSGVKLIVPKTREKTNLSGLLDHKSVDRMVETVSMTVAVLVVQTAECSVVMKVEMDEKTVDLLKYDDMTCVLVIER